MKPDGGLILVMDTGSSSMRAVVYDCSGTKQFFQQISYELHFLPDGGAEMDASVLSDALFRLMKAAGAAIKNSGKPLLGISLTSQRSSVLPVDEEGNPLSNIFLWQDQRSQEICREKAADTRIYEISGMQPLVTYSAPKMLYLKRTHPELYRQAFKLIGIHEYLLHQLTGVFCTDLSIASRTNLLDIKRLCWSDALIRIYELDRDKLCPLTPVGSIVGSFTQEASLKTGLPAGVPVITGGGDQQCALLGAGLTEPGETLINLGTGAYVLSVTDRVLLDASRLINCNVSASSGRWLLESTSPCAGLAYNWARKLLVPSGSQEEGFETLNRMAECSPPGANGLTLLASRLSGRGGGSALYPLLLKTTSMDVARATAEGIAADVRDLAVQLSRMQAAPGRYLVSGGLASAKPIMQALSDMLMMPLSLEADPETTSRGALIKALEGLGFNALAEGTLQSVRQQQHIEIHPRPETAAVYESLHERRHALQNALRSIL